MSTFLHDIAKPSLSPKSAKKIHLHPVWPENFPFFFSFFLFLFFDRQRSSSSYYLQTYLPRQTSYPLLLFSFWFKQNDLASFAEALYKVTRWEQIYFFFMSVDFLIHSDQYANTWSMEVLIRRVTCKSLFSFWRHKKVLSCEIYLRGLRPYFVHGGALVLF